MGPEAVFSSGRDCDSAALPGWEDRLGSRTVKAFPWETWVRLACDLVPWSDCATILALQMSRVGWDYLGAAGGNSAKIQLLVLAGPSHLLLHNQISSPSSADALMIFMRWGRSRGSQGATHNAGGAGCPPQALFSHWRLRTDLSAWFCAVLGVGHCGQGVVASLTLLMTLSCFLWCGGCISLATQV